MDKVKVSLDLHDWSVVNNRLDLLYKLKEHFDDFRISLFTVPLDEKQDWGAYLIRDQLLAEVKKNLSWMQIIPHGFSHHGREELIRTDFYMIEETLDRDGLPFERGYCAPHWAWDGIMVDTLNNMGWWGAIHPDKVMARPDKFYRFSHSIDEPFWETTGDLKLHGHVYGTRNDLGLCMDNLLKLPKDTDWHYVTDFLENK